MSKWGILVALILIGTSYAAPVYNTPIKHFVVVALENRSFDHLLGHLKDINTQINGLSGIESNPIDPYNHNSGRVRVSFDAKDTSPDPGHGIKDTTEQIYSGDDSGKPSMEGFIMNARKVISEEWGPRIMQNFNMSSAPIISTLALEYAMFDMWYSSVPGPTQPNRMYLHSATSQGLGYNDVLKLALGLPQKTIYQSLEEAEHTWKVYISDLSEVFLLRQMRNLTYADNFKLLHQFEKDAATGELPTFSFIHPAYFSLEWQPASDQHPDHAVTEGEKLLKKIYEALRASPVWEESALLITYDEHGGFYDHMSPPSRNIPSPDGVPSTEPPFHFNRLGVRVPTILVSPWVKRQVVHGPKGPFDSSHYEHSSLPASLKTMYGLDSYLTRRDSWAGNFESLFSSTLRKDCIVELPEVPEEMKIEKEIPEHMQELSGLQKSLLYVTEALVGVKESKVESFATEHEAGLYGRELMRRFLEDGEINDIYK